MYKDKEKQKEYPRQWVAKRRREFFEDKVCSICKSSERLELDHVNPLEKTSHRIWSWSKERRESEIKKCQILCSKCHLEKTLSNRPTAQHGRSLYNKGCRCEICYKAQQKHNRQRYIKTS